MLSHIEVSLYEIYFIIVGSFFQIFFERVLTMNELKVIENNLIKVYQTDKGEYVVDGRELWKGLGSKQDFSTWVKKRLNECDAIENDDYFRFHKKVEANNANMIEYIIKLDIAKEMAMLERNETGKQYRRYFIEVEKKYKNEKQLPRKTFAYKYYQGQRVTTIKDISDLTGERYNVLSNKIKRACINRQDYCVIAGQELQNFKKENGIQKSVPSLILLYPSAIEKIGISDNIIIAEKMVSSLEYLRKNLNLKGMIRLKYYAEVGKRCGMDVSFIDEVQDSEFREEMLQFFRLFGAEYLLKHKPEKLLLLRDYTLQKLIKEDQGIETIWVFGKFFDTLYKTSQAVTSVF